MNTYYIIVNDEIMDSVVLSDKEVASMRKSNKHASIRQASSINKSDLDEFEAKRNEAEVISKRAKEYPPIGDQLDAIMKWLATENEFSIPEELKSIAMKCMSVKAQNPLP
jgi:hypothetical protein